MTVVRLTLLNGDPLDLYDKPGAVYPLTEGERSAGGKSIVLVDGKEFRVLESIDSIKRRFETPTTANAAEVESPSSRLRCVAQNDLTVDISGSTARCPDLSKVV